jgi:hypothetical protein
MGGLGAESIELQTGVISGEINFDGDFSRNCRRLRVN